MERDIASNLYLRQFDDDGSSFRPIPAMAIPKLEPVEYQLPDLLSIEERLPYPPPPLISGDLSHFPVAEPSYKRFRPSPPLQNPRPGSALVIHPARAPTSEIARRRRSKIGDRVKILESLMPWESKMPMAAMLTEAHKYIRFLEAQVTALQTMPGGSSGFVPGTDLARPGIVLGGGVLERLNRQQMMQVMLNSRSVQELMSRQGVCLFSSEQVEALRRTMFLH